MNCIYQKKVESDNLDDTLLVIDIINTMLSLIKKANPDDYADATFPRQYYGMVLAVLKNYSAIARIHNISCEMHMVNGLIHLELMKHGEK